MKIVILSFFIYITSVVALDDSISDLRFPIDDRTVQAILNGNNIITIWYKLNEKKTAVDYRISDSKYECDSFNTAIDKKDVSKIYFNILSLNEVNVLLIPITNSGNPVKLEIVDLAKCKRTEVQLPSKEMGTDYKITKYADSFEIYYKDGSNCQKNYCRASYDFQGKVISTPSNELQSDKSVPIVKTIGSGLRSDKYLAYTHKNNKLIVNFVDSGKTKVLAEIADTEFIPEVSFSHNQISIVYRVDFVHMKLMRFDMNGNLKSEASVKHDDIVRTARIINTPNGVVYLAATPCDRDHCTDEQNKYLITKFDASGKLFGSFTLKFLSPGIIQDLAFYEKETSYCLTRAQLTLGVSGLWEFKKLDILAKCFTDDEFNRGGTTYRHC